MPPVARSVVKDCLRIKEDEPVMISTYPHTMDLAVDMALECYKVGADPFVQLETDEWFYGQFKHLTTEQLRRTSKHCLGLNEYVTVYIGLGGPKDPKPMKKVPKDKFAALFQGERAHYEASLQKKMSRSVYVALGQVTRERAKTYGFPYAAWKKNVIDSLSVNYGDLKNSGASLANHLASSDEAHITAPNGTNLRFNLASRQVRLEDGIIDDDDIAKGARSVSLPAGDVSTTIDETSARGTVVFDIPAPQVGVLIRDMSWTFERGHLTEFKASRNLDATKAFWDRASGDKDLLSSLTIGINPKAKPSFLMPYLARGVISLGIGDNRESGGNIQSDYAFFGSLREGTMKVAGKTIIKKGRIVV